MANITFAHDASVREDLLGIITNISPTETQLMTGLGTSTTTQILHQWLEDTLASAKNNQYLEGVDASFVGFATTRSSNFCQIMREGYQVSDSLKASDAAGYADAMAYAAGKAMKMWKNDAELAVLQGSLACGVTGTTARALKGIVNWIVATNVTEQSGVSLSEATLVAYLERVWNYGGQVDEIYVPSALKKKIDGFTAGSTKNLNAEDKRLVNAVDVYESSFSPLVKIFLHRHANTDKALTDLGAGINNIIGIQNEHYKIAYLRKPSMREISRTGDAVKGEVVGELTLEALTGGKTGFIGRGHI